MKTVLVLLVLSAAVAGIAAFAASTPTPRAAPASGARTPGR